MPGTRRIGSFALATLVVLGLFSPPSLAWEWSDFVSGSVVGFSPSNYLTYQEVSELRVRDIKRKLALDHGFAADELSRMLDKKELIRALAFEEEKLRIKAQEKTKRELFKQSIIITVISGVVIMCWPLLRHGWEVAHVNFVVYTDRKKLEAVRCWELKTNMGMFLVVLMFGLDLLQAWLSLSILLSWVMQSKYFFPFPRIPISPAQLMGGSLSQSSLANYGINVGPMAVSWFLRFAGRKLENWTGRALSKAQRARRREARAHETPEEKASRRAARKQAKREAQERVAAGASMPAPQPPSEWASAPSVNGSAPAAPTPAMSQEHEDFLKEMNAEESNELLFSDGEGDEIISGFDELD